MNNWVAENTRLIKSIPEQYLGNVEGMIRRAVQSGLSSKELAKQIEQTGLVTKNRAKLIAQDQIAKADAALTEYRQKDLGIDSYIWQTSEDSRVRPEHAAMNGKVIQWNKPPSIGHAGTPVRCRCRAKPIFNF
jgi:SPP1 gp7 family putative phage head morphogenesis protein